MKHYAFFYHDSFKADNPSVSYDKRLAVEMQSFPTGTRDREVVARAREDECTGRGVGATQLGANGFFTRKLIRLVEVTSELTLSPDTCREAQEKACR